MTPSALFNALIDYCYDLGDGDPILMITFCVIFLLFVLLVVIVVVWAVISLVYYGPRFLKKHRRANWVTVLCPTCRQPSKLPAFAVRVWTYPDDYWGELVMWCRNCRRRRRCRVETDEIDRLEAYMVEVDVMSRRRRRRLTIKGH